MRGRLRSGFTVAAVTAALLVAVTISGGDALVGAGASAAASTGAHHAATSEPRAPSTASMRARGQVSAAACCHSTLTQTVVDRTPISGGGWTITIEATLNSNAVCHTLLLQCVVEPELAPLNMTLTNVQCLSSGWNKIQIRLPFVGTLVDVCARFDRNAAGHDQKFRFTYTTTQNTGTLTETTKFFRFPEEFFFVRAQDTITINLDPAAVVVQDCPALAEIGTTITCHTTVEAESPILAASVTRGAPAQFTPLTLVPDVSPGSWSCAAASCTLTAGGGTLAVGTYTFTSTATVGGPAADVQDCASVLSTAATVATGCDTVGVYATPDTFVTLEKTSTTTNVSPGAPIAWTVTLTNQGPTPAQNIVLSETPPALVDGATLTFVSGVGTWTCTSSASLLSCSTTSGSMPIGTATFRVAGTVSPTAPPGAIIVNEIEASYDNNPDGPDFPVRDGTDIQVGGISVTRPTFTG